MTSTTPPPERPPQEVPAPYTPPPAAPPYPVGYTQPRRRPIGVTILAILEVLWGLLLLFVAFGLFVIAFLTTDLELVEMIEEQVPGLIIESAPLIFAILGGAFLVFALISFLVAWGFLKGKGWAWTLAIIVAVLSIILNVITALTQGFNVASLVSLAISIVIPVIIVVYLYQPGVRAWFGKA